MGDPLMEMVRIYHPNFDDGRVVEVPADSFIHHARAGWKLESERPATDGPLSLHELPKAEDLGETPKGVQPNSLDKEDEE